MKLVIDIPDEIYNHTQVYEVGGFNQENDMKLFNAIKNATPLPKGHGRLIDEIALGDIISRMWKNKQITNTKYNTFLSILDYVPTIIKADKED